MDINLKPLFTVKQLDIKITHLLLILILFFSLDCVSQNTQGSNEIMGNVNASGSTATGSTGTVAYSIGQIFYTSIGITDYNVAQGIQQQDKASASSLAGPVVIEESTTSIVVFPNPTTDLVNISMKGLDFGKDQRSYTLYDNQGRLLQQDLIHQEETPVYLTNFSSSLYILQVFENGAVLKTFKILKK